MVSWCHVILKCPCTHMNNEVQCAMVSVKEMYKSTKVQWSMSLETYKETYKDGSRVYEFILYRYAESYNINKQKRCEEGVILHKKVK